MQLSAPTRSERFLLPRFLEASRADFEGRRKRRGTHALIIGVSAYPNLPEKNRWELKPLQCAAISAFTFAEWLADGYNSGLGAPLLSLRILLSPSEAEVGVLTQERLSGIESATGGLPTKAARAWLNDCLAFPGNVAVLYVAGHGVSFLARALTCCWRTSATRLSCGTRFPSHRSVTH
jgi:hypothetical protein